MRTIAYDDIVNTVRRLCIEANCSLGEDVKKSLGNALLCEESPEGKEILKRMLENLDCAHNGKMPVCQDTGMTVVFAEVGQEAHIDGGLLEDAVNEGTRRGYREGFLRCSVVADPLRRTNTGDNTPAVIHTKLVVGDRISLIVAPKGFGSENMSRCKMFTPSATAEDLIRFVVSAVLDAGSNPCPPVVLGVGIGGTMDKAACMAKHALLAPLDQNNSDPFYAALENRMLEEINKTGIGPQGMGGTVTALKVSVEAYPTHIAGLPVAVNMGCYVNRHAAAIL